LAAWRLPVAWDMAMLGLRHGPNPRAVVTTTPKPSRLIRSLVDREGKDVVITRASTYANADNLAKPFLDQIVTQYAGTRMGRQEIDAEILLDTPGALWTRAMLDAAVVQKAPDLKRVVVAVDPSGTRGASDSGDEIGIVVAGLGVDGLAYILADRSCKLSPDGWGRRAVDAYREFKADRIIAERNFAGAMVEHVIRSVDPNVSYKEVSASRGKIARAEPVAALYEQGRVKHVGIFTDLEDELCNMTGSGYAGEGSPDHADALVWALTELMVVAMAPVAQTGTFHWG
jgi:phage terminase large subunit-like protein